MEGPDERVPPERHPWWVKFCTWTGSSRRAQWTYLWLSIGAAAICAAVLVVFDLRASTFVILVIGAVGFVVSAAWYWVVIRWIDRHGTWG